MNEQVAEYEIGKRHLAHIMGKDPDNFEQEDIDVSILCPTILISSNHDMSRHCHTT